MVVLLESHDAYLGHDPGRWHPERAERLEAVRIGIDRAGLGTDLVAVSPRRATTDELARVHPPELLDAIERAAIGGPVHVDADTVIGPGSWEAAIRAAGAGLDAMERLVRGEADAAFCAVRPPGHHADATGPRGFCLLNNIAVTAAALAAGGARVAIVDYDAHHGNGTQGLLGDRGDVLYVSLHEYGRSVYPGSGGIDENTPTVINVPLPSGTAGDSYAAAFDLVVEPAITSFRPDWLLISAGFDAHRDDPLTDMGLVAGDFGFLTTRCVALAPRGRVVAFLEGGYDLEALAASTTACMLALAGDAPTSPQSQGDGRGLDSVSEVQARRRGF